MCLGRLPDPNEFKPLRRRCITLTKVDSRPGIRELSRAKPRITTYKGDRVDKRLVGSQKPGKIPGRTGATAAITLLAAFCVVLGILAWTLAASAKANAAQGEKDQSGAGIVISAQATAKEVGLPLYPGAKPHKDEKEDSPATQLGLWGGSFGFKLVVLKMESNDSPDKIAAYYQKALAKYGTVLNCTDPSKSTTDKNKSTSPKQVDCGDDKPDAGGMLFKAGTKEKQHIVGVKPNGSGTVFQLLYIEARGSEEEKKAL
jgi:hypothetical protein